VTLRGSPDSRSVERANNLPASPFKMHIAQAKGGWMCPAAKLVRRTQSSNAQAQKLLLLLRFLFLCLLRHGGAPVLKDRKLSRNRFAQKYTMRLQQSTPSSCSIHKRLGAGVFASGLQAVSCLTELMVFSWRLLRVERGSTPLPTVALIFRRRLSFELTR
jgi:hypothetical protein